MAIRATLIPGDGIGPEVTGAVVRIFEAAEVPITWETVNAGAAVVEREGTPLPDSVIESVRKNRIALKGPLTTPVGRGFTSVNVQLRKRLDLYANLRPTNSLPGVKSRYRDVDLVVVRENTQDLYAGYESRVSPDTAVAIKVITDEASRRIAKFAFDHVRYAGRSKITAVHKAGIMQKSDGLFLEMAREVAADFPYVAYEEVPIDSLVVQLVDNPDTFDVMLLPNLFGDIVSDICAGLVGGLGVVPGANIGERYAVFEAVHGSAPDIAGRGVANPTAVLQSGLMMLDFIGERRSAAHIRDAMLRVLSEGKTVTADLGGRASTSQFTDAVIAAL